MTKEKVFLSFPSDFEGKFLVYPPKIKDVVGNKNFNMYRQLLTLSQEELGDEYLKRKITPIPTPFEYLLSSSYHDKKFEKLTKQAFLFFTKQEVDFLYDEKLILIGNLEEELKRAKNIENLIFLDENEYFRFQNKIRESLGEKTINPPDPNEHPRISEMKAKARLRDRIKAKQGKGIKLLTSLASICCMEMGINPLNIGEMSYAAISVLMETYQLKEKYLIDIATVQSGADPKKVKPEYWIKNLD